MILRPNFLKCLLVFAIIILSSCKIETSNANDKVDGLIEVEAADNTFLFPIKAFEFHQLGKPIKKDQSIILNVNIDDLSALEPKEVYSDNIDRLRIYISKSRLTVSILNNPSYLEYYDVKNSSQWTSDKIFNKKHQEYYDAMKLQYFKYISSSKNEEVDYLLNKEGNTLINCSSVNNKSNNPLCKASYRMTHLGLNVILTFSIKSLKRFSEIYPNLVNYINKYLKEDG